MDEPKENRPPDIAVAFQLTVSGGERRSEVRVPGGPCRLLDLLPAAREVSGMLTGAALDKVRAEGKTVSCRAGCGACCRQLAAISVVEAEALAELVAALPAERQAVIRARFAEAVRRLEEAGLLDGADRPRGPRTVARNPGGVEAGVQDVARRYFALQIPCPFLEDESCSIHPERPMVCREYHVTSPAERCAQPLPGGCRPNPGAGPDGRGADAHRPPRGEHSSRNDPSGSLARVVRGPRGQPGAQGRWHGALQRDDGESLAPKPANSHVSGVRRFGEHRRQWHDTVPVQAAFLVLRRLPPPAASACVLAGQHGTRAWRAADARIAAIVERVVWNVVNPYVRQDVVVMPLRERIEFGSAWSASNSSTATV